MGSDSVKEQLIQATIRLLKGSGDPSKITARKISAEAGTNLAMINYYFTSKDELITVAVDKMIASRAIELEKIRDKIMPAKQKLTEFLLKISDITVEYASYTKATIPYVLLEREIEEPYHLLPMIKECCGDKRTETECRIIASQLVIFSQIVFFRSDDFRKYLGLDIMKDDERKTLLTIMVDMLIQN